MIRPLRWTNGIEPCSCKGQGKNADHGMRHARHCSAFLEVSLLESNPAARVATIRQGLFLRLYGHKFDASTRGKILAAIELTVSQRNYGP